MTATPPPIFSDGTTPGENDIVIALMGMTGSGKSSLISLCTDQEIEVGHNLTSCTQNVETYVFHHPMLRSGRVYLVDTPGFDDTNRMDTEILRTLGAWLTATYSSGVQLSGIIYCHRINQTRMQGSAMKNIQLFRSLCGDDALRKVILVTTMWDIESRDIAEKREKELKETAKYWGRMVAKGSQVLRHHNTQQSALALIETFIKDGSKVVLGIQKEMVNDQKPLDMTEVGKDVKGMLEEQNARLRSDIQNLESELREALRTKDEELAEVMRELRLEHKQALQQVLDNQQRLQATMQQLHESKSAELEARPKEDRQRRRSELPPQSPNGVPGSSATNANKPAGAFQPSKTPPRHPPDKVEIKYLSGRRIPTGLDVTSKRLFLLSPDVSRLAISNGLTTVLLDYRWGEEIQRYVKPQAIGCELHPIAFSSDGQTLALSMEATIHKAIIGQGLEPWYIMKETDLRRAAISEDFKTTVDIVKKRVVLTSLETGSRSKLESTSALSQAEASKLQFWFAKHDKLLVCSDMRQLYFFSTGNGRLLKTEPIYDSTNLVNPPRSTCVLSSDTFLLGVVVEDNVGHKNTLRASFFQLSGRLPELVSTFQDTAMFDMELPLISLSFNGCYFAQCGRTYREISIFHVMSGEKVFRQPVDGVCCALGFFPSDNRLVWLTPTRYHISRLIMHTDQEDLNLTCPQS